MLRKPPMKTHPDGTPWEYPSDSWRDGPHFSASYLHRMVPADDHEAELIDAPLADPKLAICSRMYVVHITPVAEERKQRLTCDAGSLASIPSSVVENSGSTPACRTRQRISADCITPRVRCPPGASLAPDPGC